MSETDRAAQTGANIPELRQVGKPLPRKDAPGKAYGTTIFAGDLVMPNMLHARILRSTETSARLKKVDAARARALPGVVCVLTAWDLPDRLVQTDIPGQTGKRTLNTTQPILAKERVRYAGEALALIAAETPEIVAQALELIEVESEPLEGVYDAIEALKPGAPLVFGEDNLVTSYKIRKGDMAKGFAQADLVVENTFGTHYQEQGFLEPEAGIAWVDENDVINIRISSQVVEHFRAVAEALGVPHNKVHLRAMFVGGGFGGKENITVELYLGLLAQAVRRPVRLVLTREESFLSHGKRHPFTITHRTGVTRDGKIVAAQIDMTADAGAYSTLSPYVGLYATVAACGPYRVDNLKVDSRAAATNNLPTDAFRGFGTLQACVAHEAQMDEIAKALDMDPRELRRRNFLQTGDVNATGQRIESAVWSERCASEGWDALGERTPDDGPVKIGRGVACYQQSYGRITWFHDTSEAWVGIEVDGTVVVRCGVTDIGAGQMSAISQIAAEVLGVPMDDVTTYFGDSATTPLAGTSTATRALYMTGNAARLAATNVRESFLERAAEHFGVPSAGLDMADSRAFVVAEPARALTLAELAKLCAADGVHRSNLAIFRAPFSDEIDPETGQGRVFPDFTFGAHAAEVAVDTETGEVTVLKSVGAHDIGQAINPAAVAGQIEGSALMGQGFALCEEIKLEEGRLVTPSLSEYLIPTAEDVPEIKAIILESRSGLGPYGAKGIGEPAYTPVAAAIANAVADAIGVRIPNLPITPEKVVNALKAAAE